MSGCSPALLADDAVTVAALQLGWLQRVEGRGDVLPSPMLQAMLAEFRLDYNQRHFVRNETFKKAAEGITVSRNCISVDGLVCLKCMLLAFSFHMCIYEPCDRMATSDSGVPRQPPALAAHIPGRAI